jgi:type II secretory pathway pseudopilin PulG
MNTSKNKAFTLIELVVVCALLTGLTTVLLINSGNSKDLKNVEAAARQLESAYMQAQAFGNSGKAFPQASANFDRGYGVYVEDGSDTIVIYGGQGDINGINGTEASEERWSGVQADVYENIQLYGGVTVIDIDATNPNRDKGYVLFRRGEGEAHIHADKGGTAHNFNDDMTVTLEAGSFQKRVLINKYGLVYQVP